MSVPRILYKIHDNIMAVVQSNRVKHLLFRWALASKERDYAQGRLSEWSFWDWLVFDRIRAEFGGRIRVVATGSATLDPRMGRTIRTIFNCVFVNGYGQTEVNCASLSLPFDERVEAVGPPLPSCSIKLKDIPEMNYYAREGVGEVVVRGPIVTRGYLKNEQATRELFDEDGWLRTGDVGRWSKVGCGSMWKSYQI